MTKEKGSVSASLDFPCSASEVFSLLTDAESYNSWFGYPKHEMLIYVDPDFIVGARMQFRHFTSSNIITKLVTDRRLCFGDSSYQMDFSIEPSPYGCKVTFTISSLSDNEGRYDNIDLEEFSRSSLANLRALIAVSKFTKLDNEVVNEKSSRFVDFFRHVFYGYRNPVLEDGSDEAVFKTLIEKTEASVTVRRRSLAVSLIFIVLFFMVVSSSLTFERSDIVPSSGLSLFESDGVSRENFLSLNINQKKVDLEKILGCQGLRLNADEYLYNSSEKDSFGVPHQQIFSIYDAFGKVRRLAYIDNRIKNKVISPAITDLNPLLSPSMQPHEVESAVGSEATAYVFDKNGVKRFYFGKYNPVEIFDPVYKSEILVTLDSSSSLTSTEYFFPTETGLNHLPINSLDGTMRQQYARIDEYIEDREMFEKTFLVLGRGPEQCQTLFKHKGLLLKNDSSFDDIEEIEVFQYALKSDTITENQDRYLYKVCYSGDTAVKVSFLNNKLANLRYDSNLISATASLSVGTLYYDVISS
ncbi:MAG: hypothetical protein GX222_05345, partial [Ruminococcaceae bacterium]|nr:hypothetical protein [Oscillospiraceae bacterium]